MFDTKNYYKKLMASIIVNILIHTAEIIEILGVSQDDFVNHFSYTSKSVFSRKGDKFSVDDLDRALSSENDKMLNSILDEEKYVDSVAMTIDSFLFFGNRTEEMVEKIITLALYNKTVCSEEENDEEEKEDDEEDDELTALIRCIEKDKDDDPYWTVISQPWYKVDYNNYQGLAYQMQYIKYHKEDNEPIELKNKSLYNIIKRNRQYTVIAMTRPACMALKPYFKSLYTYFIEKKWGCKHFTDFYEDFRIYLPPNILWNMHYGELLPKELKEMVTILNEIEPEQDTYAYVPLLEEIKVIDRLFRDKTEKLKKTKPGNNEIDSKIRLILFVRDKHEMKQWCLNLESDIYKKTVFAYQDPDSIQDICFTYRQRTYRRAIQLKKQEVVL